MDGFDRIFLEERRKDRNKRVAELKAIIACQEELIKHVEEKEYPEEIDTEQRMILGSYHQELEEHLVWLETLCRCLDKER